MIASRSEQPGSFADTSSAVVVTVMVAARAGPDTSSDAAQITPHTGPTAATTRSGFPIASPRPPGARTTEPDSALESARATGLEPATSGVTGRRSGSPLAPAPKRGDDGKWTRETRATDRAAIKLGLEHETPRYV